MSKHIKGYQDYRNYMIEMEREQEDTFRPDSIVNTVIGRFMDRARKGKQKYNTTLDRKDLNLTEWVQHLQDELHDAYLYSEKLKQDSSNKEELLRMFVKMMSTPLTTEEAGKFERLLEWYNNA